MAMKVCLLLVVVAAWSGSVLGQISSYCQLSRQHTLCVNQGLGSTCGGQVQFRGVRDSEAAFIVALHNQFRSRVALGQEGRGSPGPQPQASNMRVLEWDFELANVAQSHADQCIFEHECADCRRVSRFGVGQNLLLTMQNPFNDQIQWERAIRIWYDEVVTFDSRSVVPFRFSTPAGHYTMMMWWNSQKIGCGFTMSRDGFWWKKLYTCNYGPGGNIIFSEMYRPGFPCSACPFGTACSQQYPGLCEDVRAFDTTAGLLPTPDLPVDVALDIDANYGIPHLPLKADAADNSINGFGDFSNIYTVSPDDTAIASLIEYFHNRRRGMIGLQLMNVVRRIFKGRKPCLVTDTVTPSPLLTDIAITSATLPSLTNATSSVRSTTTKQPLETSAQESYTRTTTTPAAITSDSTGSANTIATFDIAANSDTSINSVITHTSAFSPSEVSIAPPYNTESTVTTVPYHYYLPATLSTLPVLTHQYDEALELQEPRKVELELDESPKVELKLQEPQKIELDVQEPVKVELELHEPQKAEFELPTSEVLEQERQFHSPLRDQLQDSDLMPFLQRAGVNKEVIRIQSLSSARFIINSLPLGVQPIVLYRSLSGKITELDPGTLLPVSRFGRSTASTGKLANSPVELLTCDLDVSPCDVTPIGASWKIGSSPSEGRYLKASLGEREVVQIGFHSLVGVPSTDGICVALSHRRTLAEGTPTNASIPEIKVVVMPLDGDFKLVPLGGTPGLWEMSRVSFSNIKAPFLVAISIASTSTPATVAIDALQITDGKCCLSGIC